MSTIVVFFGKNFAICRYKRTLLWVDIIVLSCSQHSVWGATGCCCTLGGFHNPLQHLTTSDRDGFHTPLWHSWSGGSLSHRGRYSSEWMQTVGVSSVSSKKKRICWFTFLARVEVMVAQGFSLSAHFHVHLQIINEFYLCKLRPMLLFIDCHGDSRYRDSIADILSLCCVLLHSRCTDSDLIELNPISCSGTGYCSCGSTFR